MNYPLISEYVDAILSPEDNLSELAHLRPVIGSDNQPFFTSGNFAVVFKMTDGKKFYALKCFTKDLQNRESNYQLIDRALKGIISPHIIPFKYIANEIFVDSSQTSETEFPVVLMEWVKGITLSQYLKDEQQYLLTPNSNVLRHSLLNSQSVFRSFIYLCRWLFKVPFAHGDLKPDNIIIDKNGTCVLIDYDNMYVPEMSGKSGGVCGTPDYRHPTSHNYGKQIDFYAIAVISLSLKAYSLNSTLLSAQHEMLISENEIPFFYNKSFLRDEKLMTDMAFVDLLSLYLHVLSTNDIELEHFNRISNRLLIPNNYDCTDTTVKDNELDECITDEYGVKYSLDGTRLLEGSLTLSEYTVRDGVLTICDGAFQKSSLTSIFLPESLLSIGGVAFANSEKLHYCNLPSEVIYIKENNPWGGCFSISMLDCKSKNFSITDGILYSADYRVLYGLIYWYPDTQVDLHKSTKIIASNAFWSCRSKFHHYVKSITFDNVQKIGLAAFDGCEDAKFEINRSPLELGDDAFSGCKSLTHINIDAISILEKSVFLGCESLASVTLSKDLVYISDRAFAQCKSLTEISIPKSCQFISSSAFNSCTSLKCINIDKNNKNLLSQDGVVYNRNLTSILIYPAGKQDPMFCLPDSVTEIGTNCFRSNKFIQNICSNGRILVCGQDFVKFCDNLSDFNVTVNESINSNSISNLCLSLLELSTKSNFNRAKTLDLLTMFAERNDSSSQYMLARYYIDSKYNSYSPDKYIYWLKKAAENKSYKALCELSFELFKGKYLTRDVEKAFDIAYDLNNLGPDVAKECRGKFYFILGLVYEKVHKHFDLNKAFEYYKKCAAFYNEIAQYYVGRCYEYGIGTEKDVSKARETYKAISSLPDAKKALQRLGEF